MRRILRAITEGGLRFNDLANGNDLQQRIDEARVAAETGCCDWRGLVLRTCGSELTTIAQMAARDAFYAEGETVISLEDL